jgi:16S rRNA (guanine527-N7)-methyltransferase
MDEAAFQAALAQAGLPLTDEQMAQLNRYYELLVETNAHMNLTAITERQEVYLKHFYDSLTLALHVPELMQSTGRLIDVGAGAGFPSLPLKIALPHLQVTMMDALQKRIGFLQQVVDELGLTGVELVHGRAEDLGHDARYREQFDYATARAVARTSVLAEYTLPFVQNGGKFLAMKGANGQEELADGKKAISTLGGQLRDEQTFSLPNGDARVIHVIDKVKNTPKKYPRQAGTPNKKPIQ